MVVHVHAHVIMNAIALDLDNNKASKDALGMGALTSVLAPPSGPAVLEYELIPPGGYELIPRPGTSSYSRWTTSSYPRGGMSSYPEGV